MSLGLASDSTVLQRREFRVPHPPIRLALFLTLEEAIAVAWRWLHSESWEGFDLARAGEVDYTAALHIILQDHLLGNEVVDGFTLESFRSIERIETVNFDGTRKSKRPDLVAFLSIRPTTQPSQDGIFIECKPVDDAHSLLTDYCDAGIARFIVGDYAWAMTEALMVGYNTAYDKPSVALGKPFEQRLNEVRAIGKPRDCNRSSHNPPVAITRHKRDFPLRGRLAPPINLRHLWLAAPGGSFP
jgi:hypothetical protein